MPYEINYRTVEIPELDAFMNEYEVLCKKHGMKLVAEEYDSGGCYVTIGAVDQYGFSLNLDYANKTVPCIARALERIEQIREVRST